LLSDTGQLLRGHFLLPNNIWVGSNIVIDATVVIPPLPSLPPRTATIITTTGYKNDNKLSDNSHSLYIVGLEQQQEIFFFLIPVSSH